MVHRPDALHCGSGFVETSPCNRGPWAVHSYRSTAGGRQRQTHAFMRADTVRRVASRIRVRAADCATDGSQGPTSSVYVPAISLPLTLSCLSSGRGAGAGRSEPPWWRTSISASGRRRDACCRPASPGTVLRHRPGRESVVRRTALAPSSHRSIPSPPEKRGGTHLGCRNDPRPLGRRRTGLSAPRRSRREAGSGQHGNPTPELHSRRRRPASGRGLETTEAGHSICFPACHRSVGLADSPPAHQTSPSRSTPTMSTQPTAR